MDPNSSIVQYGFLQNKDEPHVCVPAAASGKLPTLNQMKSVSMELPGGLFYFRSRVADMPEETVPMITKDPSVGSVFLLRVDSLGIVVEILYVGQEMVEARNLSRLVGWHEAFLNSAQFAFNSGIVSAVGPVQITTINLPNLLSVFGKHWNRIHFCSIFWTWFSTLLKIAAMINW